MKNDWKAEAGELAAGAVCPMPCCGEINFAYHSLDRAVDGSDFWEFTCSRCGLEFITLDEDLLFHSVRREWLRAGNHSA